MIHSYLNASYSLFSYAAGRYAGISAIPPLPPAISVELSSRCNLSCPECITGAGLLTRRNSFISYELAAEIADQVRRHVISAWLSFQGEPMMHPDFFRIAGLFAGMNPVISTNGHFLDRDNCIRLAESPLKKIIVSYDGVTAEAYGLYRRGGDHALVTWGIRRLAATIKEKHSGPEIILQFLFHRGNEHEASAAAAFARSLGVGFRIKSMQVLDPARAQEWMPADRRKARYDINGNKSGKAGASGELLKAGSRVTRGCLRMWTTSVITADGDVVPCCFDKNAEHVMGNLENSSFDGIWRGEKYTLFRRKVMKNRSLVRICSECPQGRRLFFRH